MFPLKANEPYIKETGERSTLGAMLGEGGGSDLPEYTEADAGKYLGVDEEGSLEWDDVLPEYTEADSGKYLGVDEEGLLEWKNFPTPPTGTKIYYKDFTSVPWPETIQVAKFADNAASAGGFYIAATKSPGGGGYSVNVNGYTPISAVAIDRWTGYQYGVLLEHRVDNNTYYISMAIGHSEINTDSVRVRVFYVKNENVETMPS